MPSINHYKLLQSTNTTSRVPTVSSVSLWCPLTQRGERPVKRRSAGNDESGQTASFPPLLGSYFWGLSSGSFKWGLVTAGTSWTKLLLLVPLLCCSHSPLIGFDCICLNPQWKKEKGGWRCCSETEVCQFVQTWWQKKDNHSLGLLNKGCGYDVWGGSQSRPSQSLTETSQSWSLRAHAQSPLVVPANFLSQREHWNTVYGGVWTPT